MALVDGPTTKEEEQLLLSITRQYCECQQGFHPNMGAYTILCDVHQWVRTLAVYPTDLNMLVFERRRWAEERTLRHAGLVADEGVSVDGVDPA